MWTLPPKNTEEGRGKLGLAVCSDGREEVPLEGLVVGAAGGAGASACMCSGARSENMVSSCCTHLRSCGGAVQTRKGRALQQSEHQDREPNLMSEAGSRMQGWGSVHVELQWKNEHRFVMIVKKAAGAACLAS